VPDRLGHAGALPREPEDLVDEALPRRAPGPLSPLRAERRAPRAGAADGPLAAGPGGGAEHRRAAPRRRAPGAAVHRDPRPSRPLRLHRGDGLRGRGVSGAGGGPRPTGGGRHPPLRALRRRCGRWCCCSTSSASRARPTGARRRALDSADVVVFSVGITNSALRSTEASGALAANVDAGTGVLGGARRCSPTACWPPDRPHPPPGVVCAPRRRRATVAGTRGAPCSAGCSGNPLADSCCASW